MGISIPVGSHLDDAQARRTTRQAEDYFSTAGRRAGDEFSRQVNQGLGRVDTSRARTQAALLERAYDKAADAAGKLRIEEAKLEAVNARSSATNAQKISASERVERARRAEARATREAVNALRDMEDVSRSAFSTVGSSASGAASGVSSLGAAAARLSGPMLAGGALVMADGLINLTGVALSAAQSLWVLPAAAGAGAAGLGTLKLATLGFADAVQAVGDPKKFAEAIQDLAPNAQQAALAIQAMMPELTKLKNSAQDAMFEGSAPMLEKIARQYMPAVTQLTTGIAKAFDNAFMGVGSELMSSGMQSNIDRFVDNTVDAFNKLSGVAAPLTHALGDVMAVGSDFLPDLASGATNAAQAFADFMSNAKETGQLHTWISEGLDTVEKLGKVLWNAGDAVVQLAGRGTEYLPGLADSFKSLAENIDSAASAITGVVNGLDLVRKITTGDLTFVTDIKDYITGAQSFTGRGPRHTDAGPPSVPAPKVYGPPSPSMPQMMLPAPGAPGTLAPNDLSGLLGDTAGPPATADYRSWYGNNDQTKRPVPPPPPDRERGGGAPRQVLPTVPYSGADPMSFLTGFNADASLYGAAGSVLDNQQKVAQARSDLATLEKSGTATQSEIVAKRNELQRAEREQHEAELRLMEAKQSATNKQLKSLATTHDAMSSLGAGLDKDLGISKGLPGLADNLVRFVGSLAAAPLMAQLDAISKANPSQGGYGLTGVLAAQGVFGPEHTGISPTTGPSTLAAYPGMTMGSSAAAAIALAQSANGGRYGWGASDLAKGLADCSGAVSDLVEIMQKGSADAGRLFDTESFPAYAAAHGWQRGLMPGALNVGVSHGGQGGGHMAATLPNGVNFESGGSHGGIAYGGPAAGAGDKQFTEQWYLPTASGPMTTPVRPATVPGPPSSGNILPPLTNPDTSGLSLPGGPLSDGTRSMPPPPGLPPAGVPSGGPLSTGMPRGLPTAPLGTVGPAAQNPTQIGATVGPPNGTGQGGINIDGSGLISAGMAAGGMALNMMAPGVGQAAQTGFKLLDRGVKYLGQDAGIGVQGLMETFLPTGGSQLAQNNWLTKIAGGLAGALPAIPNIAGKKAPEQAQGGQGQVGGGNITNITHNTQIDAQGRDNGGLVRDWEYNTMNAAVTPAVGP